MRIRTLALALLALAFSAPADAQGFRGGFAPGFRSGFQFLSAAPPFTLAQLPAAARVFDLDANSGVTASSGLVSQWAATAGTLTVGTTTAAEQPTLVANGWAPGQSLVRFNGVASGNILRSSTGSFIANRWTLLAAQRPNADQNAVANIKTIYETARPSDSLSSSLAMLRATNDATQANVYATSYGATTFGAAGGFAKGSRAIISDRATTLGRFPQVNGTVGAAPTSTNGTTTRTQRKIGGSDDAVAQRAAIDIARIVEIDTDQLPGKAEQIANLYLLEGHLAWTYGTQASLRVDHPYVGRAPILTDYTGNNRLWQTWGNSIGNGLTGQFNTVNGLTARGLTITNGCVGGTTSTQIRARFDANQDANGGTASGLPASDIRKKLSYLGEIWQNDAGAGISEATTRDNIAYLVAQIEAAQGAAPGQGHILLEARWVGWGSANATGTAGRAAVTATNSYLQSTYPNYYIDTYSYLAAMAAPGGAYPDAQAFAAGQISEALHSVANNPAGQGGTVAADPHPNTTGYGLMAGYVHSVGFAKGWVQ